MRERSGVIRNQIITAAHQLFLSNGYAGTPVAAIAKQAAVTKRTVYRHFSDKQAIFKAVVESAVGDPWEFHIPLRAIVTTETLRTTLCLIGTSIDEIISQPDYVRLLRVTIAEIPAQQDLSLLFERGVTGRALRLVTEVLETAAKLEIIRITDADAAARQFVGGFVTRLVLDGLLRPTGEHLRKRTTSELQSYVDSFLGRIANRRSSYMSKA